MSEKERLDEAETLLERLRDTMHYEETIHGFQICPYCRGSREQGHFDSCAYLATFHYFAKHYDAIDYDEHGRESDE